MARIKFNTKMAKDILKGIAVATGGIGLVVALAAMPGMGMVAKEVLDLYKQANRRKKFAIRKTFKELRRARLIEEIEMKGGLTKVVLSEKGKKHMLIYNFDDLKISQNKNWDGQWRFVIFDLPKRFKKERELFRLKLKIFGFQQVNRSVWVYPYNCREELDFIVEYLKISPYVRLMIVSEFDGSADFKDSFNLS